MKAPYLKLPVILFLSVYSWYGPLQAQNPNREEVPDGIRPNTRKALLIPDIPGYVTLTGDFHMHTVFSDGEVWPVTRVKEAWFEGLDAIAITDHVEYRPHKEYISGDMETSYQIAESAAREANIILVKGAEITRSMPPGHLNALFVKDARALANEDPMLQIEEANRQGAFVFWNHPGWDRQQPDTTLWWDYHTTIYEKGWLHGIEVNNGNEWYPLALGWCISKDLTVMANTDMHGPATQYRLSADFLHRSLTILFCKERSLEGVKEALFEGRTLGWFGNMLAGKEELIRELCNASVTIRQSHITTGKDGKSVYHYELENPTHLSFILRLVGEDQKESIIELLPETVARHSEPELKESFMFEIINCYSDMLKHPEITFRVKD